MKSFFLVSLLILGLLGNSAFAQTAKTTKTPAAPVPAAAPSAPEPAKTAPAVGPVTVTNPSATSGARAGTIGVNGAWNKDSSSVGLDWYLDSRFFLRPQVNFTLAGQSLVDSIPAPATTDSQSAPSLGVSLSALNEIRILDNMAWSWGGRAGISYAGSEQKPNGGGSTVITQVVVTLAGIVDLKYFVVPGIAVYLEPTVALAWQPIDTAVVTDAAGVKSDDKSGSSFSFSTATAASSLGFIFYLN